MSWIRIEHQSGLVSQARDLNPKGPGPDGAPRPSSAGVAVTGTGLAAGRLTLRLVVPETVTAAVSLACTDDPRHGADEAVAAALALIERERVTRREPPDAGRAYYRAERSGVVHSFAAGQLPAGIAHQVRTGELVALSPDEVTRYMNAEDEDR